MKKTIGVFLFCLLWLMLTVPANAMRADADELPEAFTLQEISSVQTVSGIAATGEQSFLVTMRKSPFTGVLLDVLPAFTEGRSLHGSVMVRLQAPFMDDARICACFLIGTEQGEIIVRGEETLVYNGRFTAVTVDSGPLTDKPLYAFLTVRNSIDSEMTDLYLDDFFAEAREWMPTPAASATPTAIPTAIPTAEPTQIPEHSPTLDHTPTPVATERPTERPTATPTTAPEKTFSAVVTASPTALETMETTADPVATGTYRLTANPTNPPEQNPSQQPQNQQEQRTDRQTLITSVIVTGVIGAGIGTVRWLKARKYHE